MKIFKRVLFVSALPFLVSSTMTVHAVAPGTIPAIPLIPKPVAGSSIDVEKAKESILTRFGLESTRVTEWEWELDEGIYEIELVMGISFPRFLQIHPDLPTPFLL
ncbi:MAG: hypothetical protein PHS74_05635 [Lachnospiraceae bacterium]|nr:hypothetical protein [Lachnospiraceae bacterium]